MKLRRKLESSAIDKAVYDEDTAEMKVTFTSGRTYRYYGVPRNEFIEFVESPSAGRYFNINIRGSYEYREV